MSTKPTPSKSQPGRIAGLSRQSGAATDETKQMVINATLKKADEYGLSNNLSASRSTSSVRQQPCTLIFSC